MNKKMRELQAQITELKGQIKGYMVEGEGRDVAKATELMDQVEALQKEYDAEKRAFEMTKSEAPVGDGLAGDGTGKAKADSIKALADAARSGFKANMNEGTGADGGYTVPEDISTRINKYKEEKFSLASLIDHETVKTKSGRRTYKTRAQHTGFAQIGEGAAIGQTAAPKFSIIEYVIKKFAGYLPVTNELLEDSDAEIANTIIEWLGDEDIATENAQVLAKVNEKEATAMTGIDDIKKAVNVTLAAFKGSVSIVTNSDGLQYLDTLKDKNGRYLLSPDPANPMNMFLAVGARKIPVIDVPNDVLTTPESGALPFIVGDLKEYMKEFDRKQMTLHISDTASVTGFNAFEQDMTLFRAIKRADYVIKDAAAIVRGELVPAGE